MHFRVISEYIFVAFVAFILHNQQAEGLRILAFFPLQGPSRFIICESLAKGLAEKGHKIDVYSHFPQKKQIPNYTDYSLEGTLPIGMNNVSYEFFQQLQSVSLNVMMNLVGDPVCELMNTPVFQDLFIKLKKHQPYDIVIIESFVANCFFAWGRYLNVPMIGIMTTPLIDWYNEPLGNPVNTAVVPSCWSNLFHPMNFWERLKNSFMYYSIKNLLAYHINKQNKYVEQFFGKGYPDAFDLIKDLDLLLVNSHYSIDGIRPYTPAIVSIGGLHLKDSGDKLSDKVQKWLDESRHGCIYFSLGSMVRIETFPKPILDAFYAAFKAIAPVRVLLKITNPEELPTSLPSNVMTQKWYSQIQVLKHKNTKVFVTHGGFMSTLESLSLGVPIIGIPLFGDQYTNVKILVRRKIGVAIELNNISESTITDSIKEILNNPVYKKNAEKLSKEFFDRPMNPMDTASFWIEYVARHGKNSLKSPVMDLPWWQAQLIDVYGFILFILIAIYYILKLAFKKLLSFCLFLRKYKKCIKIKSN